MSSPTTRASNTWPINGGDDVLQIQGQGGDVVSGIDSTGAGFGALAGGGGAQGNLGDAQFNDGTGALTDANSINSGALFRLDTFGNFTFDSSNSVSLAAGLAGETDLTLDQSSAAINIDAENAISIGGNSPSTSVRFGNGTCSLGFFNQAGITQPIVTGSKAGNVALTSLITQLAALGLIIDSTT